MRRLNSKGISLIEAVVAVAILGFISLGVMTLVLNMNQQFSIANVKTESVYLSMQVEGALRSSAGCLGNMTANSVIVGSSNTLTQLRLYNAAGVAISDLVPALNANLPGGSRIRVTSMTLTAPLNPAAGPVLLSTTATTQNFGADLVIALDHSIDGPPLKPLRIAGLQLQTNLAGTVTSCKVGTSLICVTGVRNGSTATNSIAFADPGFTGNFATVFSVIAAGGNWGLSCNPGWNMTGCRGSALVLSSTTTDASLTTTANGCESPNSSIAAGMNSSVFLTCCSSL